MDHTDNSMEGFIAESRLKALLLFKYWLELG